MLALAASPAIASAGTLDLEATVRFALAHDPALLAKRATVANLVSTFVKQRATEYPSVVGELQNQLEKSSNAEGQFAQFGILPQSNFSQNTAQISSQWTVYNGSLNQVLAQEDRRQVEAARADLQRAESQTAADVAGGFYGLVAKRETTRLDAANAAYEAELLAAARANERVGRSAGVDTLRAQVAQTRAEATLISAQADEANAREALANEVGAPLETQFALPAAPPEPPLPQVPLERLLPIAEAVRADVASAVANLRVAQLTNAAIDTDLRPQIALNGAFGNQTSPTSFVTEAQQIAAENAASLAQYNFFRSIAPPSIVVPPPVLLPPIVRGNPGFWQIGATATLQVPIIDYGARSAAHRAARAQIVSAEAALGAARSAVELDVRQALRAAQTSAANLQLAKESAGLARESARIAQLQFKNGLISFTDADATEQTALSAQTDLANAEVAYVVSLVKLQVAVGLADPVSAALLRTS